MKWKHLTRCKGDDGFTDFQGERINKSDYIMELFGEIDTLNAHLGLLENTEMLQLMNREVMGLIHTKGETKFTQDWMAVLDDALDNTTSSLDVLQAPLDGWVDYDHHIFVAMCQTRKVERIFCKIQKYNNNKGNQYIYSLKNKEWEKFIRMYNRLSKLLYCLGNMQQVPQHLKVDK